MDHLKCHLPLSDRYREDFAGSPRSADWTSRYGISVACAGSRLTWKISGRLFHSGSPPLPSSANSGVPHPDSNSTDTSAIVNIFRPTARLSSFQSENVGMTGETLRPLHMFKRGASALIFQFLLKYIIVKYLLRIQRPKRSFCGEKM